MVWETRAPIYQPHAKQFAFGLTGSCTFLAYATCDIVAKGIRAYVGDPHAPNPNPASVENVQAVMYRAYQQARRYGLCAPNGAADQSDMLALARLDGLPVRDVLYYADPMPAEAWVNFLRMHVAHSDRPYPVLMQVAAGQMLRDAQTGSADEPTLQCHAIALYGTQTDAADPLLGGYIGADGDSPDANDRPVVYNLETLAAARPISAIAFDYVK